jgi:hypothetical protein
MDRQYIEAGGCYTISVGDVQERRVLVDWVHPEDDPSLFHTWDIETGDDVVLAAEDFLCPCEATWEELVRLAPEARARSGFMVGRPAC